MTDDEFMQEAEDQGLVWSNMDRYLDSNEYNDERNNIIQREISVDNVHYAKGGQGEVSEEQEWINRDVGKRYMIYTEKGGEKPIMRMGMNNKIKLKGYVEYFSNKFPSENVLPPPLYSKLFNVEKLFEGESLVWSSVVMLVTAKSLSSPEKSSPRALALVYF